MQISDILRPEGTRCVTSVASKKRLLQDISDIAAASCGLSASEALNALQEREALGPTGVGKGVALPHARVSGITRVCGVFLRLEKPLDFEAVDRQPVDLVFALFAPAGSGVDHLKALARVSRTLRDPGICAKLRSTDNPSALYAIVTDEATHKAA
ncbi:MAG: PTS sugar transporter subunit IIA [Rhodobacteraceae bacterium]|nr:PTS sugar transporter subunit IIA [Paracoccaceae bacterium]